MFVVSSALSRIRRRRTGPLVAVAVAMLVTAPRVTVGRQPPAPPDSTDSAASAAPAAQAQPQDDKPRLQNDRPVSDAWKKFSQLPLWEDGLSEMSYYDATCILYDKPRHYTRVHLMNRQYMHPVHHVKADKDVEGALPIFKFVIAEEVPTENYNYRFLITAFMERPALRPIKVSASSQEWCGHTFKFLDWERRKEFAPKDWSLDVACYSYFGDEGDRWYPLTGRAYVDAYECLFLFARAVVASGGEERPMSLLKSLRTNHMPDPNPLDATLKPVGEPRSVTVPLGRFEARRVVVDWEGDTTWFDVETAPPYRLLAFHAGDVEAKLRFVERRAYWDRSVPSGFYKQGQAP